MDSLVVVDKGTSMDVFDETKVGTIITNHEPSSSNLANLAMDFAASLASNAQRQFNHGYSGFHPWNQDLAEDYNDLLHTSPHVKANPSFAQGFIPNGPDFHQQQAGQVQFDPHHPNSFASSPTQDYTTHNVHQGSPNHYNTFMQQGASTDLTNLGGNFSPCSSPCPGEGVATCCEDDGCEEESGSFYCADNKCSEAEDTCDDERCFPEACVEDACRGLSIPCNDATCFVDMADNHGSYQQYMTQSDAAATLKLLHDNNPSLYTEPHTSYAMESPFLPSHAQQGWLNNTFPPQESCQGVNQIGPETALGLAQHIIAYHEPCNMRDHERPCLADRFQMQFTPRTVCALPKIFASLETGNPAEVMGSEIPIEQQSQVCGITCNDIVKFSQHLFDDHKALINSFSAAHSLENGHPKFVQEDFQMEQYQPTHIESNVLAASLHNPTLNSSAREFMTSSSTSPPSLEQSISMEDTRTDESLTPMTAGHASSSSSPPLEYICSWAMMGSDQVCGSTFDSASNLHEHCVHTHVRSWDRPSPSGWTCKWADCTRHDPFPTKSKLERHMQVHSQFKPVNCPICGLSLSAVQALNQHMRIHTGEKPWECKYCDMSFKQQSALTMHVRTHTKLKPLECEFCGRMFGESSNLSKHRRTHHTKKGYECSLCDRCFHRPEQLRKHLRSKHKKGLEEAEELMPADCRKKRRGSGVDDNQFTAISQGAASGSTDYS